MNFIKNNWLILIIGLFFLIFSVLFPDIEIIISGGFAWFVVILSYLIGGALIWTCIFGGELKLSSKGFVGWIKEFKKRKNNK